MLAEHEDPSPVMMVKETTTGIASPATASGARVWGSFFFPFARVKEYLLYVCLFVALRKLVEWLHPCCFCTHSRGLGSNLDVLVFGLKFFGEFFIFFYVENVVFFLHSFSSHSGKPFPRCFFSSHSRHSSVVGCRGSHRRHTKL